MERDPQLAAPTPAYEPHESSTGALPRCPNCGWQNVRFSHSRGVWDAALEVFSVLPFRCRSCGARFHRLHRISAHEG